MANLNDRETNREPNPHGYTDSTQPSDDYNVVNPDPIDYREGYEQGRAVEQHRYEANQQIRDNDNASRGILLGILLTSLVAIALGGYFWLNQRNRTEAPVNRTIVVPTTAPSPSVSPSPSPEVRERVIERDRIVPVPQSPAPAPNINVTVPQPRQSAPQSSPAPSTQQQSSPAPAASPEPSSQPTTGTSNSTAPNSTNSTQPNSGSNSTTTPATGSGQ